MTFWGRSVVSTWFLTAGDKTSCFPASRLIATAPWACGPIATAAAASPEAGLAETRGEPATISRTRGVIAELSPAAGFCELVPGIRAHDDDVQARGDSCDDAP